MIQNTVMSPKDFRRLQRSTKNVCYRLEIMLENQFKKRSIVLKQLEFERFKYLEENHLIMFL